MHSKAVTCLVPMGDHVWSASLDHLVVAWDAQNEEHGFHLAGPGRGASGICAAWGGRCG